MAKTKTKLTQKQKLEQDARITQLVAALQLARAQLVTLGGSATEPDGDIIQRVVLAEIDKALLY